MELENIFSKIRTLSDFSKVKEDYKNKKISNKSIKLNKTLICNLKNILCFDFKDALLKKIQPQWSLHVLRHVLFNADAGKWTEFTEDIVGLLNFIFKQNDEFLPKGRKLWWSVVEAIIPLITECTYKSGALRHAVVKHLRQKFLCLLLSPACSVPEMEFLVNNINMSLMTLPHPRDHFSDVPRLGALLCLCADFSLQLSLLEMHVLLAIAPVLPQDRPYSHLAHTITRDHFDESARRFLNQVNLAEGGVVSMQCEFLIVGDENPIRIEARDDPLWADWNGGSKTLTVMCQRSMLGPPAPVCLETLTVQLGDVKELRHYLSGGLRHLSLEGAAVTARSPEACALLAAYGPYLVLAVASYRPGILQHVLPEHLLESDSVEVSRSDRADSLREHVASARNADGATSPALSDATASSLTQLPTKLHNFQSVPYPEQCMSKYVCKYPEIPEDSEHGDLNVDSLLREADFWNSGTIPGTPPVLPLRRSCKVSTSTITCRNVSRSHQYPKVSMATYSVTPAPLRASEASVIARRPFKTSMVACLIDTTTHRVFNATATLHQPLDTSSAACSAVITPLVACPIIRDINKAAANTSSISHSPAGEPDQRAVTLARNDISKPEDWTEVPFNARVEEIGAKGNNLLHNGLETDATLPTHHSASQALATITPFDDFFMENCHSDETPNLDPEIIIQQNLSSSDSSLSRAGFPVHSSSALHLSEIQPVTSKEVTGSTKKKVMRKKMTKILKSKRYPESQRAVEKPSLGNEIIHKNKTSRDDNTTDLENMINRELPIERPIRSNSELNLCGVTVLPSAALSESRDSAVMRSRDSPVRQTKKAANKSKLQLIKKVVKNSSVVKNKSKKNVKTNYIEKLPILQTKNVAASSSMREKFGSVGDSASSGRESLPNNSICNISRRRKLYSVKDGDPDFVCNEEEPPPKKNFSQVFRRIRVPKQPQLDVETSYSYLRKEKHLSQNTDNKRGSRDVYLELDPDYSPKPEKVVIKRKKTNKQIAVQRTNLMDQAVRCKVATTSNIESITDYIFPEEVEEPPLIPVTKAKMTLPDNTAATALRQKWPDELKQGKNIKMYRRIKASKEGIQNILDIVPETQTDQDTSLPSLTVEKSAPDIRREDFLESDVLDRIRKDILLDTSNVTIDSIGDLEIFNVLTESQIPNSPRLIVSPQIPNLVPLPIISSQIPDLAPPIISPHISDLPHPIISSQIFDLAPPNISPQISDLAPPNISPQISDLAPPIISPQISDFPRPIISPQIPNLHPPVISSQIPDMPCVIISSQAERLPSQADSEPRHCSLLGDSRTENQARSVRLQDCSVWMVDFRLANNVQWRNIKESSENIFCKPKSDINQEKHATRMFPIDRERLHSPGSERDEKRCSLSFSPTPEPPSRSEASDVAVEEPQIISNKTKLNCPDRWMKSLSAAPYQQGSRCSTRTKSEASVDTVYLKGEESDGDLTEPILRNCSVRLVDCMLAAQTAPTPTSSFELKYRKYFSTVCTVDWDDLRQVVTPRQANDSSVAAGRSAATPPTLDVSESRRKLSSKELVEHWLENSSGTTVFPEPENSTMTILGQIERDVAQACQNIVHINQNIQRLKQKIKSERRSRAPL